MRAPAFNMLRAFLFSKLSSPKRKLTEGLLFSRSNDCHNIQRLAAADPLQGQETLQERLTSPPRWAACAPEAKGPRSGGEGVKRPSSVSLKLASFSQGEAFVPEAVLTEEETDRRSPAWHRP